MTLLLKCKCGKKLKAPKGSAGKRAMCSSCGKKFIVPSDSGGDSAAEEVNSSKAGSELDNFLSQFEDERVGDILDTLTDSSCPQCGSLMESSQLLCSDCGYHTGLNRTLIAADPEEIKDKKETAFVYSFIAVPSIIVVSYLVQQNMEGRSFLAFYFMCFLAIGLLVPILRRFWVETTIFEWSAMVALLGIGGVRLGLALYAGRTNVLFLVFGMMLVAVFFFGTTRKPQFSLFESHFSPGGKYYTWFYLFCLGIPLSLFGIVCSFPKESLEFVRVSVISGVVIFGGFGLSSFLDMLTDGAISRGGGSGGYHNNYSSYSSCGSSCGGGCGGGGCGGGCGG